MTPLEQTITAVAARCIGTNVPIHGDTAFELLGLDSLATIELAAALETELGCVLPPDALAECRSIRSLAARLSCDRVRRLDQDPYEQMFQDAVLPDDVWPVRTVRAATGLRAAKTILVTGATGFVGGALIEELRRSTKARIICLVRSPNAIRGVCSVRGDLTQARLGLGEACYADLAREVDAVVHCGAAVNWVFSYAALRAANVLGTRELLRLACEAGASFHFVSSLSVCYPADGPGTVDEGYDPLTRVRALHLGYAQTKAVAEALVREAGGRGLPVRIYRPALVFGHSETGAYNRDDLIAALVRGCVAMGTAPDLDWKLDAVPVDVVARSILELSSAPGPVFHIDHPHPRHWRECVLWMRMYGYDVRLVSYPAWLRHMEREIRGASDHPLRPLRSFFTERPPGGRGLTLPQLYEECRRTTAVSDDTDAQLSASGVTCPPLDASLLDRYFGAFVAAGDLPRPRGSRVSTSCAASRDVTGLIASAMRSTDLDVRDVELLSTGSDHSIISELTAWRSQRRSGLFHARLTMGNGTCRNVMAKLKASDADVVAVGAAVADTVDPAVGRLYRRWSHQMGFAGGDAREIAIYRQQDPRFLRHAPAVLATVADDNRGTWLAVLEHVSDSTVIDTADQPAAWTGAHVASAIDGLAALQSIWFGREDELHRQPWIGHVHSVRSMAEMSDLWGALAAHAAPVFSSWDSAELPRIHQRLVDRLEDWWSVLEAGPCTLIHNDFNPRNVCLRGPAATLCAYDWELATIGAPQRDLAEFLCFVLPASATAADVLYWIERHRAALVKESGIDIDAVSWMQGFRSALCDVLVNRLAIYCLVHRVRRQSFLPRVVSTWGRLYRLLAPDSVA